MSLHRVWTVWIPMIGALLGATGCGSAVDGLQSPGLEESASAVLVTGFAAVPDFGRVVRVGFVVRNTSGNSRDIAWTQGCDLDIGVRLRVYRQDGGRRVLAWDSSRLPAQVGCQTQTIRTTIAPGDSDTFYATYRLDQVLGDSLPPGSYQLTVTSELVAPALPGELPAGTLMLDDSPLVPPGTDLSGTWAGGVDGVFVTLSLTWTPDSVYGSGRYTTYAPNTLGCGLGTLGDSGTVRLEARRRGDYIGGTMIFDDVVQPPYGGMLDTAMHISGEFFSVDTGPCPFDVARPV